MVPKDRVEEFDKCWWWDGKSAKMGFSFLWSFLILHLHCMHLLVCVNFGAGCKMRHETAIQKEK